MWRGVLLLAVLAMSNTNAHLNFFITEDEVFKLLGRRLFYVVMSFLSAIKIYFFFVFREKSFMKKSLIGYSFFKMTCERFFASIIVSNVRTMKKFRVSKFLVLMTPIVSTKPLKLNITCWILPFILDRPGSQKILKRKCQFNLFKDCANFCLKIKEK